jgi:protein-L-isoaspartate(D-aspartate) O-methyltransferase
MDLTAAKTRLIASLRTQIGDERVLSAIASVPREDFIPPQLESLAYSDEPLPIGHNQTISQPYVVAKMTEALELKGPEKVLEIGTGSGYQTAILAKLARLVVSTERIPELSESAARLLKKMGYANIHIEVTGSELGWESEAPYDAIIVTAATPKVPDSLLRQLATGGRMVIPVGDRDVQELYQITKFKERNQVRNLGGVRFVPLIADEAWQLK